MKGAIAIAIAIAFALAFVGCDAHHTSTDGGASGSTCRYRDHDYAVGQTWPAGDDCNDCTCAATGFTCTARPCHAPADADPATLCQPNDTCTSGVGCGSICCAAGERCDFGVCMCGAGSACGSGDTCASAGPSGGDNCGSICCGATGPCPQ